MGRLKLAVLFTRDGGRTVPDRIGQTTNCLHGSREIAFTEPVHRLAKLHLRLDRLVDVQPGIAALIAEEKPARNQQGTNDDRTDPDGQSPRSPLC